MLFVRFVQVNGRKEQRLREVIDGENAGDKLMASEIKMKLKMI